MSPADFGSSPTLINICSYTESDNNATPPTSSEKDCITPLGGGFITVIKNALANPGSPAQMFSFNINQGANLVASPSILNSGSSDRFGFDVGTFSVAETVPVGWSLTSASCTGAGNNGTFSGSTISNIQLVAGDDIFCTFNNTQNNPTLHIEKTKLTADYDAANDILGYSYVVTNTGNTIIYNIAVTDDKITLPNVVTCNPLTLNPGQQSTCSAQYTTVQSDVDDCSVTNNAFATGTSGGTVTSNTDQEMVGAVSVAMIQLVKNGVQDDANNNMLADVNETIDYTFQVTNNGNTTLNNVTVSDPLITNLTCVSSSSIPAVLPVALALQDYITCAGTYPVTQNDINTGFVDNTASASGSVGNSAPVTDNDSHQQVLPVLGKLSIEKTGNYNDVNNDTYGDTGDKIDYIITVTNIGNITLTNVSVSDLLIPGLVCIPASPISIFNPGDSTSCSGIYNITLPDITIGSVMNTAMASGQGATPVEDSANVPVPPLQPTPTATATNTVTATATATATIIPTREIVTVECKSVDLQQVQLQADGIANHLRGLAIRSVKALERKSNNSRSEINFGKSLRTTANALYKQAWDTGYIKIPSSATDCNNQTSNNLSVSTLCSVSSLVSVKNSHLETINSLRKLIDTVQQRQKKYYRKGKLPRAELNVAKIADTELAKEIELIKSIPDTNTNTTSCVNLTVNLRS